MTGITHLMIFDHSDPINFLKEVLTEKVKQNPSYSLRAFAQKLGLSPGGLSQILARRKKLSVERAHALAGSLGLKGNETEYFITLVQRESVRSARMKAELLEKAVRLNPRGPEMSEHDQTFLSLEHFKLISEWYGLATLELITVVSGKWTSHSIARHLGISRAEADSTIERLKKLELIEVDEKGGFRRTVGSLMVTSHIINEAIQNYYTGVHARSAETIRTQTPKEKVIGAQVFAFDPAQIEAVREATDRYLNELNQIATRGENRTVVYQAVANFFRLSKNPNAPEEKSK